MEVPNHVLLRVQALHLSQAFLSGFKRKLICSTSHEEKSWVPDRDPLTWISIEYWSIKELPWIFVSAIGFFARASRPCYISKQNLSSALMYHESILGSMTVSKAFCMWLYVISAAILHYVLVSNRKQNTLKSLSFTMLHR